ncbi:MAG: STAS domain-containing protein [Planctomycetes bacterium]|nr:STAS domain-containing protein [Planctomycetota bacterium]
MIEQPVEQGIDITTQRQDGIVEVIMKGYIDAYTYTDVEKTFNRLVEEKVSKVILDMSKVKFLGAVGAGLLITLLTGIEENKGKVVILKPSSEVKEVLDLVGLSAVFPIANDNVTAWKSVLSA